MLCTGAMIKSKNLFATVEFWYSEHKGVLAIVMIGLLIGLFFLFVGLPKSIEEVTGVAYAQVYHSELTGNEPKLAVKLSNGALVHVNVGSPGQIKVGTELCLYKSTSYAGTQYYSIKAENKCT